MSNQAKQGPKRAVAGIIVALLIGGAAATGSFFWAQNAPQAFAAKVNGQVVSEAEFLTVLERTKKQYAGQIGMDFNSESGQQMLMELKKNLMNSMVEIELMRQQAEQEGLSVSEDEVKARYSEFLKSRFQGNEEMFAEQLKKSDMSREEFDKQMKEQLLLQKLYQKVIDDVKVSDEDIKTFYDENIERFKSPEQINAQHILIKTSEDDPKSDAAAKAKMNEVQAKLKAGGDFAKLAQEYSDDPGSKVKGGDLGKFGKGQMVPPFEEAAWKLQPGEISEPVKTRFGYHLIKRGESFPAGTKDISEVKEAISGQLLQTQQNEAFKKWLDALKAKASIITNEELLKAAPVEPVEKPAGDPAAGTPPDSAAASDPKTPAENSADKPAAGADAAAPADETKTSTESHTDTHTDH